MTRQTRHAQIPIVEQQIAALREMARTASGQANGIPDGAAIGFVMTSNMLAGLALELGLKLFFMTYREEGPPRSHELSELFNALPDQIRGDIRETYANDESAGPDIKMYGFMTSSSQPVPPNGTDGKSYQDADVLFLSASDTFVRSRYFFEGIDGSGWTIFDHPIDYMLKMSEVLEVVYKEYKQRGGWGDPTLA